MTLPICEKFIDTTAYAVVFQQEPGYKKEPRIVGKWQVARR